MDKFIRIETTEKEARTANSTYPKGGVSCSADTFVQAESSVLRMKFCGKSPALRVAAVSGHCKNRNNEFKVIN